MLDMHGKVASASSAVNGRKTWKAMIIDAAIIGAIAAFASIGGEGPTLDVLWTVFKAFGLSFFMQLAVERGLKRPPVTPE